MPHAQIEKLISTVPNRCRVCYSCVRECPVKAIKIVNGQAEILTSRCIGCGSCFLVCSQGAKAILDTKPAVQALLESGEEVIACVAPSFAAEFSELDDYRQFVGMVRTLGFSRVVEVSFGADLVAREYKKVYQDNVDKTWISSDCPAIVYYVEHYMPEIKDSLVPVVSPMVATVRVLKQKYGAEAKTVFIGPCIAKKGESNEVDEVITFRELREIFASLDLDHNKVEPVDFDPPYAGKGALFPVSRGMLNTIGNSEDLVSNNMIVSSGKKVFIDILKEMGEGV